MFFSPYLAVIYLLLVIEILLAQIISVGLMQSKQTVGRIQNTQRSREIQ